MKTSEAFKVDIIYVCIYLQFVAYIFHG